MNALATPSFAHRPQRGSLRQAPFSLSRPRAAGHALATSSGIAPDCVFKRFPAIGDTPSAQKQRG
jgi:hypothetical protein